MNILNFIFSLIFVADALTVFGLSVDGRRSSLLDRSLDRALDKLISEKHLEKERRKGRAPPRNYLATDDMVDGEHEIRLHFTGVSAKQTSVGPEQGSPHGLVLREVSDGRQLVYLVYTGVLQNESLATLDSDSDSDSEESPQLRLRDCQVMKDPVRVSTFVDAFREESRKAETTDASAEGTADWRSVRFVVLHSLDAVPASLHPLVNFRALRRQCRRHHKAQKKAARRARRNRNHYSHLDSHKKSRLESQNGSPINPECHELQADISAEDHLSRTRRSITDLFILPGTLWCGSSHRASTSLELSGHMEADACCRVHDFCPWNIGSLTSEYGLFNSNFFTMSHCGCDTRFRTCLKSSNTGAANLVGRVFFDVVATECFVFEKRKVCQSYNWYGTCRKWGVRRQAVLRNPMPWVR